MPEISEKDLARDIKQARLAPVYLLYGEEPYLKRLYSSRIEKAAVTDFAEFNLHRFEANLNIDDLFAAVDAMPMFSERTCVIVRDFNFGALADKAAESLCNLIKQPNEACVLVFLYENAELPNKSARAKQILAALKAEAHCISFLKRTERELAEIACSRAKKMGVRLDLPLARYLISRCGDNLENLLTEIDKLCDYVGKNGTVTQKEIDEIAVRTVEASAFRLADAICAGNRDEALSICADLFDMRTDPLLIIGALSSTFVDLYRVKLAEGEGLRPDSIVNDFGYGKMGFKLRRAAQTGKRMSQQTVMQALEILRKTDLALKTSRTEPRIIIERAVILLMRTVAEGGL